MKRFLKISIMALLLVVASSVRNRADAQVNVGVSVSYQTFYDELSPYGRWIDYPSYGYVWMPNVGAGFQPYSTNGHWVWTDEYEWMWVSGYNWGWAPFHYGRWFYDDMYGWMWMPGYEWSPAWVAWRDGGDYYGWAPLRPGISISIGFASYNPPASYWCFAPRRYIASPRIYDYYVPRSRNVTIINNTTIINNYNNRSNVFISGGPDRRDAERYAGTIRPARFRESNTPGRSNFRNNEVTMYRPAVQRSNNRENIAPRNFESYDRNSAGNRNNNGDNRRNVFDRGDNNTPSANGNSRRDAQTRDQNADNRRNVFDRGNNDTRNNDNNNRDNNTRNRREVTQPGNTPDNNNNRRNVFDRGNNNDPRNNDNNNRDNNTRNRREVTQPGTAPGNNRSDVFDRGNSRPSAEPSRPSRNEPAAPQQRNNNVFDRGNNSNNRQAQPERRQEMPRFERREQPSQESRGRGNEQRGSERPFRRG